MRGVGEHVEYHPVARYDWGTSHGWYIGRMQRWGLLPGDEAHWPSQWEQYAESSGIGLSELGFQVDEHRVEFARDVGI